MNNPLLRLLIARLNEQQANLNRLALYASGKTLGLSGSFWKGRKGRGGDMTTIAAALVQDDQIGPCIDRLLNGQLDRDPDWQLMRGEVTLIATTDQAPEDDEGKVVVDEAVDALTTWHHDAKLLNAAREAAHDYQWAGRMVGRVYIPDAYRDQIDARTDWTLDEALQLVHVQAVDPRDGGPITDAHGRVLGYYFAYQQTDPVTRTTTRFVELHGEADVQLYQRVGTLALNPLGEPAPNPLHDETVLGSRRREYLMFHADRLQGSALTDSILDAQDRLNIASTYMGRNDDMSGFRVLVTGNAEQPVDAAGKPTTWKFAPDVVLSLVGLPKDDRENPEVGGRETPVFQVVDPLDPTIYSIPSINHWKRSVHAHFDQAWALDAEQAVSGESKRVTRRPFDKRVIFASVDTAAFIAWALRAAHVLASSLVSDAVARAAREIRARPRMYLDVDSQNLDEYRAKLTAYKDGALDLETLLESTPNITDVTSVRDRIRKEQEVRASAGA